MAGQGAALAGDGGHELDEIAVVSSNADPCHVKYGSGPLATINGPRLVPGRTLINNKYINVYLSVKKNQEARSYTRTVSVKLDHISKICFLMNLAYDDL